jgi:hypothetical protein
VVLGAVEFSLLRTLASPERNYRGESPARLELSASGPPSLSLKA